jgi:hypothetical protein
MEIKALQFGAKFHELIMLSSLSFVVFYYMRRLLVGRNGIPFGLVSAPHIITSPSMLLKRSFWVGWGCHPTFGALLFVACILSFALGLSSAITIIPSLGWSEINNAFPGDSSTIYYPLPRDKLWSTVFDSSNRSPATGAAGCIQNPFNRTSMSCPTAGFLVIYKWVCNFTRRWSSG